ncbi:MAG: DUF5717 family protein [Lachnospiraceae bacterium]|nr:DUF5717 family protein [Lachnospiraceae bacterium]
MRRRMQELAAGVYEKEGPKLVLSKERIELSFMEGETLEGSFEINSTNQVLMRGIVYSDNPRMVVKEAEFSGTTAQIDYKFDTEGLVEGDIQKGSFFIICNKNEYSLSFVVSTKGPVLKLRDCEIDSLDAFCAYAKEDYKGAYQAFVSDSFVYCLKKEQKEIPFMRRVLAYEGAPLSNLEEFLVSTGKKKPVHYSCNYQPKTYEGIVEDLREVIEVTKDGWGYSHIEVSSDAEFLVLQSNVYNTEDFIGYSCSIPFFICVEKLHAGMNYGRIKISAGKEEFSFDICCSKPYQLSDGAKERQDMKSTLWELTSLLVDYQIKKVMPASWAAETLMKIEHLLAMNEGNSLFWIAKAQVLIMSSRSQEAQWILDHAKKVKENKLSLEYAYYLYVTTLLNHDKIYVHRVAEEIREIYLRDRESDALFWMMLQIGEAFENSRARKYQAIKRHCQNGSASPVFYAEAFELLMERPELLEDFGDFEVKILNFGFKKGLLTKKLGLYMVSVVGFSKHYYPLMTRILEYFYNTYQGEDFLEALCMHFIGRGRYGKSEFRYYELAVEAGMMIHGLYEAFIISAYNAGIHEYPKMVQYYFQYKTNLSYKYKAFIYAGIIQNKEKQQKLYESCKQEMEEFAYEQLNLGHMNEHLAVIYSLYLSEVTLTHEMAKNLAPLLYVHKLTVEDKNLARVVVVHRQLKKISTYPIINGVAYFPIYAKDRVIGFEDFLQQRYIKSVDYDLQLLLTADALTKKCLKLAPEQMPYLIHFYDYDKMNEKQLDLMSENELGYLNILLSSDVIEDEFKKCIRPALIGFYHDTGRTELLDEYLRSMEFDGLTQNMRILACELLIERGFFERAFVVMVSYGCNMITASYLLTLCCSMIEELEYEEDDYLLGLCILVFKRHKFNEVLLKYLSKYMYGSTKSLYDLWLETRDFGIDTFELEERLLVQMMYTEKFVPNSQEILSSYMKAGGKKLVLDAYISYFAYQYFVKESMANTLAMQQIYDMEKREDRLFDCLKLALLKWLLETESKDYETMKKLYDEFILDGYRFEFFGQLPKEVTVDFPRNGKVIIEYRTGENATVYIRSKHSDYFNKMQDDYKTEKMEQMYDGIFVKEATLFYGDTLQYYISELQNNRQVIMTSGQVANREIANRSAKSRYDKINALIIAETLGEHRSFEKGLEKYDRELALAKKEFKWTK